MTRAQRKIACRLVAPLVLVACVLGLYNWHGPFGTHPVIVRVPGLERLGDYGQYYRSLPDFIFVASDAPTWVVPHESLHYAHPSWSECQVSNTLADEGIHDYYYLAGACAR